MWCDVIHAHTHMHARVQVVGMVAMIAGTPWPVVSRELLPLARLFNGDIDVLSGHPDCSVMWMSYETKYVTWCMS